MEIDWGICHSRRPSDEYKFDCQLFQCHIARHPSPYEIVIAKESHSPLRSITEDWIRHSDSQIPHTYPSSYQS